MMALIAGFPPVEMRRIQSLQPAATASHRPENTSSAMQGHHKHMDADTAGIINKKNHAFYGHLYKTLFCASLREDLEWTTIFLLQEGHIEFVK